MQGRGHEITVLTCQPRYNLADPLGHQSYPEVAKEDSIRVIRVKTLPHHKVNFLVRGLSQILLPTLFIRKIRKHGPDAFDAVIVYSPPLPLWRVGAWLKKRTQARFILNIQDIFPQNAIDLGALSNPALIRLFERMETKAYQAADKIVVHSQGNQTYLTSRKQVPRNKVQVVHNWIDLPPLPPRAEGRTSFRKQMGLEDRFVFFFGGVIGPSQGLDLIVQAAKQLQNIPEIALLIVGDGTEKKRLEDLVARFTLDNVLLKPFVAKPVYQQLLKEMDLGLISLTSKNKTPVVPGKMLGYMAASVPCLALLNAESDGHEIIKAAECGYSGIHGDVDTVSALMRQCYEQRERLPRMGQNGYDYARKHFSQEVCVDQLEAMLG